MADDGSIRDIIVAGGGIVGWTAAATLRKRVAGARVTILALPPAADALADRMGGTLPSAVAFHADIGINEADLLPRTGSAFRLGTLFDGWAEGLPPYLHSYGDHGRQIGPGAFHHHWLRAKRNGGAGDFASLSASGAMAWAGRFVHPAEDPASPLSGFDYGLQLNPSRYRDYMRAYALHLGVIERSNSLKGVKLRQGDGFIESLQLTDGSELEGHLFLDCTGPAAVLHSALSQDYEDWGKWLPCDRILFAEAPPPPDIAPYDKAVAMPAGWRWEAANPAGMSHGLVHAAAHLSESKAERVLRGSTAATAIGPSVSLRQGRRPEPWLRNCVAIGDAAVSVEPLESANLHLAHSALDRLVTMMPDRKCAPVELSEYNRQCAAEANRVRDFLVLHYHEAKKPKQDFWRAAAAAEPPPSLAHTLELFCERGILPFHEEETFPRDSWLAVLLGQGTTPRRTDPVAEALPVDVAEKAISRIRDGIAAMVPTLPSHSAYLRHLYSRVSR